MEKRWVRIHSVMYSSALTKTESEAKHLKTFLLVLCSVFASQLSTVKWCLVAAHAELVSYLSQLQNELDLKILWGGKGCFEQPAVAFDAYALSESTYWLYYS